MSRRLEWRSRRPNEPLPDQPDGMRAQSTREDAATQPHLLLWGDAEIVRRLAGITVI
jgi:hypothetical protein